MGPKTIAAKAIIGSGVAALKPSRYVLVRRLCNVFGGTGHVARMEQESGEPQNVDELDDLLRHSALAPSQAAVSTSEQLAREVRDEVAGVVPIRRPRRTRGRIVLGAAAAVVALTGAGTLTANQLSIPPFVTIEEGVDRATTGVPISYTNSLGRQVECLAFIEYRNLTSQQRAAIEDASRADEWDGYGQQVLDDLNMPNASPERQNNAIGKMVHHDLWRAARAAVPEIVYMRDSKGPAFVGSSMSCANPGGVDGRP